MIFQTERLLVRKNTLDDADNFFLLNGNEEVMRYIRPAKNREDSDAFLKEVIAKYDETPLYGRWAVLHKITNEYIGGFAIIPVENSDSMQLGYSLLPEHWGKGYATELTMGGLHYVFTKTDIDPIYGYTEVPNIASQNVLLKSGFFSSGSKFEGGKELMEFVYEKRRFKM